MFGSRLHILDSNSEIFGACTSRMETSSAYLFPENFDIVSVIKGSQTVLWRPVTSGGVVRFERYSPHFYKYGIKMHGSVMVGSYDRLDKNIDTIFGNFFGYLRLIGIVTYSDDYTDADNYVIPSSWNKWNANIIFGFTPIADFLYELHLSHGDGQARYGGRGMDAVCFSRNSYEIQIKKDFIYDNLKHIDLIMWHHYINHIMTDSVKYISRLSMGNKNGDLNQNNCANYYVDRIMSGIRSIFICQWKKTKMYWGADLQINKHRRAVLLDWYTDSYFQDMGAFIELYWQLRFFDKLISGIRMEHTVTCCYPEREKMQRRTLTYPAGFIRYEHIYLSPISSLSTYIGIGANESFPDYWELIVLQSGKKLTETLFIV